MFKKILIVNRGEIALRILRACRELDIKSVLAYSEADKESLPVKLAEEKVCIGPSRSVDTYLNIPNIISAVEISGADSVHPGYGFLAESIPFAEVCKASNIKFIGPTPENIKLLGDKSLARKTVNKYGVPILPGSENPLKDKKEAKKLAREVRYPIILKASGGGGGKGMRIVRSEEELEKSFEVCQQEAISNFDNPEIYLEKFLERPRHIEVQILSDNFGNIVSLGERDCSLQRRHQKLIEEAPSPVATPRLRRRLSRLAKKIAKIADYRNAGTIEFLVDNSGHAYFMEMNTRVQVEHPVTEIVTGIDIVKEQIRISEGERLSFSQRDIHISGSSIECRINAEDPQNDFRPSAGRIERLILAGGPGIRIDTHIYQGYEVPPYYDSLLLKLIAFGKDRSEALKRMERALLETKIEGVMTTIPFYQKIFDNPLFLKGRYYVGFIETFMEKSNSNHEITQINTDKELNHKGTEAQRKDRVNL